MLSVSTPMLPWSDYVLSRVGEGTLSPMDEFNTQKFVATGPYAYVRNPMIAGVFLSGLALSLLMASTRFFVFIVFFVSVKTLWFVHCEEPSLRARFGKPYEEYLENVPRWFPSTLTPYAPKKTN